MEEHRTGLQATPTPAPRGVHTPLFLGHSALKSGDDPQTSPGAAGLACPRTSAPGRWTAGLAPPAPTFHPPPLFTERSLAQWQEGVEYNFTYVFRPKNFEEKLNPSHKVVRPEVSASSVEAAPRTLTSLVSNAGLDLRLILGRSSCQFPRVPI